MLFLVFSHLIAQDIDRAHPSYQSAKQWLPGLVELLAIPNDANHPSDIEKNVLWCESVLGEREFDTQRLETATVPLLLALPKHVDKEKPTVLFYFHIDGQPVDPQFWFQEDPYIASLKKQVPAQGWVDMDLDKLYEGEPDAEWRIFARSASDDKSPFVMFLAALDAFRQNEKSLPYNLKVILDFEEEKGSPRLAKAVEENKAVLQSDYLIIFDGPKHLSNVPTISYGARGITTLTIKTFGPKLPLHSGHYGNYAPNPALRLSKLLAGMKDDNGRVSIPGYYDGITLDEETKKILAAVPDDEQQIRLKIGIGEIDQVGANYQEALQYPSLNIRGMSSAWVGEEVRTIVPATAVAEIDLRLVVEADGDTLKSLVKEYIQSQGYHLMTESPSNLERLQHPKICQISERGVTRAFRTDMDSPLGIWTYECIKREFGTEPVRIRTMGGTLPTSPFISTLAVPAVIVPLVNSDNNQHSPNENLRIGNYFDGAKTIYSLLSTKPE